MTFDCPATIRALLESLDVPLEALARRSLVHYPEALILEVAEIGADGREHRLTPEAANAWRRMRDAAATENVQLHVVSAFRTVDRQAEIIRAKLRRGLPLEAILEVSAAPGFSEHHSGLAVDIGTPGSEPLTEAFEQSEACRWLQANAASFGFELSYPRGNAQGYAFEPWHWRYAAARLRLVAPDKAWRDSYIAMVEEFKARKEPLIPFPLELPYGDFDAMIATLANRMKGVELDGFVANSTFWLMEGAEVVGASNLRHELTPALRRRGGNIGYGIRPSARGKGFGRLILAETLRRARELGLAKALITCDKQNTASAKIIAANGGVLDSEERMDDPPAVVQRYWITL